MENNIPTAEEFLKDKLSEIHEEEIFEDLLQKMFKIDVTEAMIEFAKLHVEKIKDLQQSKYYAGETGYIKKEEWEELLTNIK
jgi:hypothetical protein